MSVVVGLRLPRLRARLRARRAVGSRRSTRSTAGGSCRNRGLDIDVSEYDAPLRRGARRPLERAALAASRAAAPTSAGRSRGSRSATTGSRRSRRRPRAPPGSTAVRAQPVQEHRRPRGRARVRGRRGAPADRRVRGAGRARGPASSRAPASATACTEAPRGILYHRYELDDDGTILDAKIVPPTSQNQRAIEEDLRGVVERSLDVARRRARRSSASRRSATTTRASRARRTSSRSRSSVAEGDRRRQPVARRRRGRASPSRARSQARCPRASTCSNAKASRASLIDAWDGAESVWLVDAISSGAAAGTVHRLDASEQALPAELFRSLDPPPRPGRGGRARTGARQAASSAWSSTASKARLRRR